MISINNLSYYLGDRVLYEEASLFIGPRDRIGLIGLNGTGKSTLLKIMVGEVQSAGGEISRSKETTLGFLNQDLLSFQSDDPILEVAMLAFKETLDIQHKINHILHEMEHNYRDELVEKLAKLQEKFEAADGYTLQSKAEEILEGIGFTTADLQRPLREFSGGWRMRVMLAKMLLEKPSLLMLDEPTNHLDLPSIQWLESYLQSYEGAYIIVSHDRTFLNKSVTKIVEVSGGKLNVYSGNYDFYLEEKSMRNEIQQNAYENQQQKIRQAERFIERFKAKASKAKQAQSRVKMLEKIDRIEAVVDDTAVVNFRFNFRTKSGRHVKILKDLTKSYSSQVILKNAEAHIERGDKIALIGANGKGKSTLLRIIAGTENYSGDTQTGHNVITSFFAQHQLESLGLEHDLVEELKSMGSGKSEQELRGILGCFLFGGDEVYKKIKVLSGGEKSRVALAKTLISEANFLLLDEPTNHLDMLSVGILVQALQQYEGTFLVVSHDRHFISQIANKIWWIENNEVKVYPGTYEEFEWWFANRKSVNEEVPAQIVQSKESTPSEKKIKVASNEKEIKGLENQIEELENNLREINKQLSDTKNGQNAQLLSELTEKQESLRNKIEELTEKWEVLLG